MTTLTISIDRTSLSPLVMLGHGTTPGLGVSDFVEPAKVPRITVAPTSAWIDGDAELSFVMQKAILGFEVFPDGATTETQAAGWIDELATAVLRLNYNVTVTVAGRARTWRCTAGSLVPLGGRTVVDLRDHKAAWSVSLPCHPIPVS